MMLSEILGVDVKKFINIVAFSGQSTLKLSNADNVLYFDNLVETIESYSEEVLTKDECNFYIDRLNAENITDKEIRKQHIESIREKTS